MHNNTDLTDEAVLCPVSVECQLDPDHGCTVDEIPVADNIQTSQVSQCMGYVQQSLLYMTLCYPSVSLYDFILTYIKFVFLLFCTTLPLLYYMSLLLYKYKSQSARMVR